MTRFLVEAKLPDTYVHTYGLYVQTCACIEYQICSVICKIEELQLDSPEWLKRHNKLRNFATSDLITCLNLASKKLESSHNWRSYLIELCGWMHRFSDNRHLAVHGVHVNCGEEISVNAAPRNGREQTSVVTLEIAIELLRDADKILRNLIAFCDKE